MNSIDEAFSSVKQYCRKEGRISEAAMKLWIDIMTVSYTHLTLPTIA